MRREDSWIHSRSCRSRLGGEMMLSASSHRNHDFQLAATGSHHERLQFSPVQSSLIQLSPVLMQLLHQMLRSQICFCFSGVHIVQFMVGCEWDDETGKVVGGYYQYGYDGEDFFALDQNMESYIAAKQEAVITKHNWDQNKADLSYRKNYLTQICPEWVQKYLNYGRSSLMRTERPSVSLLQKTSSSPVICHATGFYPNRAEMFWRKNGEETHEGVDKGEILPNNDGTFQMSVDLKLPSSEDWTKYECVFQLSGVNDDIITHLEKAGIRTNEGKSDLILPVIIGVLVAVVVFAVVGLILYKKNLPPFKKNDKRSPSPESRESKESSQKMLPQA